MRRSGQFTTLMPLQVARADHEVGAGRGRVDHRRQVLRIVRQVGVHLADEVVVGRRCARRKPSRYDTPRPRWPVRCSTLHAARIRHAELVGDLAGAVRRLIVEHHHRDAGNRHQIRDEDRQVVLLVVGRDEDQRLSCATGAGPRTGAPRSAPRPGRPGTRSPQNISSSTAPLGMRDVIDDSSTRRRPRRRRTRRR